MTPLIPVWTDRGEHWPSVPDAASAVDRAHAVITWALDKGNRFSAGRRWYSTPPAWRRERDAKREADRRNGIRVDPGSHGVKGGPVGGVYLACGRAGGCWSYCARARQQVAWGLTAKPENRCDASYERAAARSGTRTR